MRFADQIRDWYAHIDILVNDIWGAELLKGGPPDWNKPVWQVDLQKGLRILRLAIDTHLITSHYLLPFLIEPSRGTAGRGDGRHRRLQRIALPNLSVL